MTFFASLEARWSCGYVSYKAIFGGLSNFFCPMCQYQFPTYVSFPGWIFFGKTFETPHIHIQIVILHKKNWLFYIAAHCFVFYFPSRVQRPELCHSVLTKMPVLFCLYFLLCHVLCFLFCFNAQAEYCILILARKGKVLSFYRTFQRFVLF
jgi:hypothetical protein